jgi:crotonobetainyl-CoA:carnitine CoA-transferase CaiB-like acyl-CoA transferase
MPIIREKFLAKERDEWVRLFTTGGVEQVGPVQEMADLAQDPMVLHNEYIVEVEDPRHGKVKVPGICVKLSETPGKITKLAPELGQHTEEVLMEVLGYTWDDIAKLRDEGAF